MSVLIKGMEMPKACEWCSFISTFTTESGLGCRCEVEKFEFWDYSKRQENCPLVEVPTPHGRLIDADRLLESIKTNFYEHFGNYDSGQELLFDLICNSIEDSLTIIEAEVSE